MKLHELAPNAGSTHRRKRVARGISAGQGKTAGRGTKGQGARQGGGPSQYFQGGNLPFFRKLPFKRGFSPLTRVRYQEINLDQLTDLPKGTVVTPELLAEAGLVSKAGQPVAVLGRGELKSAITVRVQKVSGGAKTKIEAAGGKVEAWEALKPEAVKPETGAPKPVKKKAVKKAAAETPAVKKEAGG
ncbi:MAG: 50S ribosomal protein L15 [Anaerolineales bacterium]|nr:50S ribosomal protein L15 [Anaerolineales bacterium]